MNQLKPVVLITGALTGIGRATAQQFAKEGHRLVISGRHPEAGAALAADLAAQGAEVEFVAADVRHEAEVEHLIARTQARFGRLDIAINNAGTEGMLGPVTEQTAANFNDTFATNVLGVLLAMKYQLRLMQAQGSGSIVNISSVAGQVGFAGASVYAASKHAVEGLTKSAALEVAASGIRVNAVAPGPVDTGMLDRFAGNADNKAGLLGMMPAQRAASVEEIAETICFVAGDRCRYLTGQSIVVDGGYLAQ